MNARTPDTLTAGIAEKYIVSIRLRPDGLSFAGYIPSVATSFVFAELPIEKEKPFANALKELFFTHQYLSYSYRKVYVVWAGVEYTLVPEDVFSQQDERDIYSFVFTTPAAKTLHALQKELGIEVVFGFDAEAYEFLSRTVVRPTFTHAIAPILLWCRKMNFSVRTKQLFASFYGGILDLLCFERGDLLFANSFSCTNTDDAVYYILYVWKELELDQHTDALMLYAPHDIDLLSTLQQYIAAIGIPESGVTEAPTPLDIKALFECES